MQPSNSISRGLAVTYAVVVFISAFLLFQVQPLIGKIILPWFGGSPAVWSTCMLVFQLLLFGGYAYAHLTTHYLSPLRQAWLHIGLLLLALLLMPIAPDASWKPSDSQTPALRIILLLSACIGLPYFILSSTSPLVQAWFSRTHEGQSPYRLYSLSNVGSLLALLSYPFLVEPLLSTIVQSWVWSWLFAGFAGLCGFAAAWMVRACPTAGYSAGTSQVTEDAEPSWNLTGLWFGLAMTASVLLLATTNQVCLDVAVVPFLWVIPLALYLITFILCFDSERWYARRLYVIAAVFLIPATIWLMAHGSKAPIALQTTVYFGMMFSCCMICHGELAKLKPHPRRVTAYFLTISAGGAAGGLFVSILAPLLFVAYNELQFGIVSFILLFMILRMREDGARWLLPAWTAPATVVAAMLLALLALSQLGRNLATDLTAVRNFYGVLRVLKSQNSGSGEPMRQLAHGRITHGLQFTTPEKQRVPTAYYAQSTGIGQLMQRHHVDRPRHLGIVGLGVGTLAAYGREGDRLRMYEINPQVVDLAKQYFTYLSDCPAEQDIVTGDARLSLEFESPQQFDILVLDAFSGDAIPVHLLTREAMEVYSKHLAERGVLACHISNLHFNLAPVIAGLAEECGLRYVFKRTEPDQATAALPAIWAFVARDASILTSSLGVGATSLAPEPQAPKVGRPVVWTDNRSNLLEVLW